MSPTTVVTPDQDGRWVAFVDRGPKTGPLVFYLHGLMASRLERPPNEEDCGVRIVTVDRPGEVAMLVPRLMAKVMV